MNGWSRWRSWNPRRRTRSRNAGLLPGWSIGDERGEGPRPGGDRGAAARRGMEPQGGRQEAPDVRLASRGLRRVRGVAVREGHARAGAVRQRLRDGGLPEDPPALRRLPDAPELSDQEGGGGGVTERYAVVQTGVVSEGVAIMIRELCEKQSHSVN